MSVLVRTFESIAHMDRMSLHWVAGRRTPFINRLMRGFTHAGDWQTWTLVILSAFALGGPFRALALQITPRLLLTLGVCYGIKCISKRPRPSETLKNFSSLLTNPDPYSFPSSHTACAWVVCASLGLALGWGWPIWIMYASAISYSRIYVGAHYPLDVFIGTCLGVIVASL